MLKLSIAAPGPSLSKSRRLVVRIRHARVLTKMFAFVALLRSSIHQGTADFIMACPNRTDRVQAMAAGPSQWFPDVPNNPQRGRELEPVSWSQEVHRWICDTSQRNIEPKLKDPHLEEEVCLCKWQLSWLYVSSPESRSTCLSPHLTSHQIKPRMCTLHIGIPLAIIGLLNMGSNTRDVIPCNINTISQALRRYSKALSDDLPQFATWYLDNLRSTNEY